MKTTLLLVMASALTWAQPTPPNAQGQITVGSAEPEIGRCIDTVNVGNVYVRSQDPGNAPIGVARCTQTGPARLGAAAYAWQPIGHFVGPLLPARCAVGDFAYRTVGVPGLYVCDVADHWSQSSAGGGGGLSPTATFAQMKAGVAPTGSVTSTTTFAQMKGQ